MEYACLHEREIWKGEYTQLGKKSNVFVRLQKQK